ncbi:SDR family NAD(P)-dependent oxidoreductase [Streptomyces chromofuscus]|uniref:SDR family NAD(P)-dependent oxidoreductase n=1 Tax=Streptomyces chromofuscus TaxID=42881 RepID=UPI0016752C79|nr:SDR family oxidoreductase [Streptomyces chromofuscus]GGT03748.1 3-oxoacyl-ACP reductase [Streptomyces chromofuscus]
MSEPKVAIITGASQGIGARLVTAYRDAGYRVVAVSRSIKQGDDSDVLAVAGDVARPAFAGEVVDAALRRFGRVDTLVNNAGLFVAKPFTEHTDEDYERVVAVNIGGFFNFSKQVIEPMLKQGGGHVVSITTTLVEHALSELPSVLASITKGGMNAATRELAIEYATRGIRFNAVSPGMILTPLQGGATAEQLAEFHPNKRVGTVDDVAKAVMYLEDSPFVTGDILHVDGGQSAGH